MKSIKNYVEMAEKKAGDQPRLAGFLSVKQQSISRYLNGDQVPAGYVVLRLARYLGVDT